MKIENGSQLRKYRKNKNLTMKQLAEELGVKMGTITNVECKHPRRKLPVWLQEKVDGYLRQQKLWYKVLRVILFKRK